MVIHSLTNAEHFAAMGEKRLNAKILTRTAGPTDLKRIPD